MEYTCVVVTYGDTFKGLKMFEMDDEKTITNLVKRFEETMGFLSFYQEATINLIIQYFKEHIMEEHIIGFKVTFIHEPMENPSVYNKIWEKSIDEINKMDMI